MSAKRPVKPDQIEDDLDALIDNAVDTFFVEAPSPAEYSANQDTMGLSESRESGKMEHNASSAKGPSLDEVVSTLFMNSFKSAPNPSLITSGDPETDRAIDLAVDTLFVEEPESPPPETAEVKLEPDLESRFEDFLSPYGMARDQIPSESSQPRAAAMHNAYSQSAYDAAMEKEIERHMRTLFGGRVEPTHEKAPGVQPGVGKAASEVVGISPLRKLQEAILTLEWEISRRSITVLANELRALRRNFKDNVIIDFAALAMRVVLEYIVKRMSKAHPESIRFLLETADYLDRSLAASEQDPLRAFHHILNRYEKYKTIVRKAEGLPDSRSPALSDLEITDPAEFALLVEKQAKTLIRAGHSLAKRLANTNDPESLIRSFRFLVNRSVNCILQNTHKDQSKQKSYQIKKNPKGA